MCGYNVSKPLYFFCQQIRETDKLAAFREDFDLLVKNCKSGYSMSEYVTAAFNNIFQQNQKNFDKNVCPLSVFEKADLTGTFL